MFLNAIRRWIVPRERRLRFCCPGFRAALEEAGQRGIAVIVIAGAPLSNRRYQFFLQARAVGLDCPLTLDTPYPVSLIMESGLSYCPWCGANLERYYQRVLLSTHSGFKIG